MRYVDLLVKRLFDFCACLIGLIFLSPFILVICIAIKADSKGPVFFHQERIGLRGKVFKILKFRTMVINAESIGEGLICRDEDDPRITKVGRLLRKTSLDELPQLINVLAGDMSIVGPRPPVTYHPYKGYDSYSEFAKKRFDMRPGITGLAQVLKRNSAAWDERIVIDVRYIENFNLILDMKIIIRTFSALFYREEYTENIK